MIMKSMGFFLLELIQDLRNQYGLTHTFESTNNAVEWHSDSVMVKRVFIIVDPVFIRHSSPLNETILNFAS